LFGHISTLKAAARFGFLVAVIGQGAFPYYIVAFLGTSTLQGDFEARSKNAVLLSPCVASVHQMCPAGGYEMMQPIAEAPPHPKARITGVVYLLYFLTAISSELFMKGLVVSDDAAATANNILAHEPLFRLGLATGLIATAWYVALTALFYFLFKPVDRSLSLLAAFFSLVGCAILSFASVFQLASSVVLGGSQYLGAFNVEQLRALALLFLNLRIQAVNVSLVFFAFYCLLIGYLIFRSAFLPRTLEVLMALAGLGWLAFLSPRLANQLSPYIQVFGFLAEVSLMIWLLAKGVNVQRWKEQACAAEARQ
jgi:hypothetical protein